MDFSNIPPELFTPITIGLLVGALTALATFALVCLNIWDKIRRKPSVDVSIAGLATKTELKDARNEINIDLKSLDERLSAELKKDRKDRSDRDGELFKLIRDTKSDLQKEFSTAQSSTNRELNQISKEIGKLAGILEGMQKKQ